MRRGFGFSLAESCTKIYWALGFLAPMMMLIMSAQALADTQECIMKRAAAGKGYDLKRGDRVYNRWPGAFFDFFILEKDQFREISGIDRDMVDCQSAARKSEYPIVLNNDNDEGSLKLFRDFGILPCCSTPKTFNLNAPYKSPDIGAGHYSMKFSMLGAFGSHSLAEKSGLIPRLASVCQLTCLLSTPETGRSLSRTNIHFLFRAASVAARQRWSTWVQR